MQYPERCMDAIVEDFSSRQVVLFLGAGISLGFPSQLPSGIELRDGLRDALLDDVKPLLCDIPSNFLDSIPSPEVLYNAISESAADKVPALLKVLESVHPNVNHQCVASLLRNGLVRLVITTNFDTLIETAVGRYPLNIVVGAPANMPDTTQPTLWKVHGSLERTPALALSDVSLIGLTDTPIFLERVLRGKVLYVVGYSGNDIYLVNAIVKACPTHVCWFVRDCQTRNLPVTLGTLRSHAIPVSLKTGDLMANDSRNAVVAIWENLHQRQLLPDNPIAHGPATATPPVAAAVVSAYHDLISQLSVLQRGLVLNSLVRRAGVKTTLMYRQNLSRLIWAGIHHQGGSAAHAFAENDDWVHYFECLFTPHLLVPQILMSDKGAVTQGDLQLLDDMAEPDRVQALLGYGLEKLVVAAGDDQVVSAICILRRAWDLAQRTGKKPLRMHVARALAWAYLRKNSRSEWDSFNQIADEEYAHISRLFQSLNPSDLARPGSKSAEELKSIRPSDEPLMYDRFLSGGPLSVIIWPLVLAGCLRSLGATEGGAFPLIEASENMERDIRGKYNRVPKADLHPDAYRSMDWLQGYIGIERGRCLFACGEYESAIEEFEKAKRLFEGSKQSDAYLEGVHYWGKIARPYYVRVGEIVKALTCVFEEDRVY